MADETNSSHLQEINQEIYKRNLELAIVNKTLSLLRKLYQISLLSSDIGSISEKVSNTIRSDLNMEIAGIFLFDAESDTLTPFKFSKSDRMVESLNKAGIVVGEKSVVGVSTHPFFRQVISEKKSNLNSAPKDIWPYIVSGDQVEEMTKIVHVETFLWYPLVANNNVIGVLLLALNRGYDHLNDFEKDAINSCIDVVAVALDKALVYEKLRLANEQLQALDKARAEFISIASHQLRTPPATIKWYLNAILAGDFGNLDESLTAALKRTNVTNDAQIATIDDLLNASRIERGKLEFFFDKEAIEPIVSALVEQMQPLAQMKKLIIEYAKPSAKYPDILMDKEKIRQVINNMMDNAIKYSKSGPIKVSLSKDSENIIIKVTDSGKGIAKKELSTIFQKYTRGHDSVTHATGLGLGMYVAKVIIEQHNGKIWAESGGVGKGATFAFSLPIHSNLVPTAVDLAVPTA